MPASILDEATAGVIMNRLHEALSLAEQSGDTLVVALISDAMDHVDTGLPYRHRQSNRSGG